jgi:polyhydroxybutyrate depolymerase
MGDHEVWSGIRRIMTCLRLAAAIQFGIDRSIEEIREMTDRITPAKSLVGVLALVSSLASPCAVASGIQTETIAGRKAIVYLPENLGPAGSRALVVVLHGGMGNAERIATLRSEGSMNMNAVADEGGFIVAYLNGTRVSRALGPHMLGWNAGSCCGLPVDDRVDDVAYLMQAIGALAGRHGIDRHRVFGVGHSNGAMMTQRMLCETGVYAAAVPIAGGLETGVAQCPAGQGKRIMAIHGADDRNVPLAGGRGKGLARVDFASQAETGEAWHRSGAIFDLQVIAGADHSVDTINAQITKTEFQSLAQKMARFFGLLGR